MTMVHRQPGFKALWVAPGTQPVPKERVNVELSSHFNRAVETSDPNDARIVAGWAAKTSAAAARGGVLFNGTKFRLHQCIDHSSNSEGPLYTDASAGAVLTICLGITDYRALCGTNFALRDDDTTSYDPRLMGNALGVESLLITADDYVVLFRRSAQVAENSGWYCCPGGHAEPCNAIRNPVPTAESSWCRRELTQEEETLLAQYPSTKSGQFERFIDADVEKAALPASDNVVRAAERLYGVLADVLSPAAVLDELYRSALDEVVEETGAPHSTLVNEGLVAVVVAENNRGKPDACFRVRTSLTGAELSALHATGTAKEAYESDGPLKLIPLKDVSSGRFGVEATIAPPSLACLQLCLPRPL